MKKSLRKNVNFLTGIHDGIYGDVSGIFGKIFDLSGDVSGIYGDVTGVRGNLDNCEITEEERKIGVNIADLIGMEEVK